MVNEPLPQNIRTWGMSCHLVGAIAALIGTLTFTPFLFILFPFVVWRIGRDRHPFIEEQGQAVINFLLSMSIYSVVLSILSAFLTFLTCSVAFSALNSSQSSNFLGWMLLGLVVGLAFFMLFQLGLMIFAGIKAYRGQAYQYPFTLGFLGGGSIQ